MNKQSTEQIKTIPHISRIYPKTWHEDFSMPSQPYAAYARTDQSLAIQPPELDSVNPIRWVKGFAEARGGVQRT